MTELAVVLSFISIVVAVLALGRGQRNRRKLRSIKAGLAEANRLARDAVRLQAEHKAQIALKRSESASRLPLRFRAQACEDVLLWELLGRPLTGTFIEAGAYDGLTLSVSCAFESMGWRVILVEPLPTKVEACRQNRPGSTVVHAALGRTGCDATTEILEITKKDGDGLHSRIIDLGRRKTERVGTSASTRVFEVPQRTLSSVIDEHLGAGACIDAASIDVEEAEASVLDGLDLRRHRPRLLLVENNQRRNSVAHLLEPAGYVLAGRHYVNDLYIEGNETEILRRAHAMPLLQSWIDPAGRTMFPIGVRSDRDVR